MRHIRRTTIVAVQGWAGDQRRPMWAGLFARQFLSFSKYFLLSTSARVAHNQEDSVGGFLISGLRRGINNGYPRGGILGLRGYPICTPLQTRYKKTPNAILLVVSHPRYSAKNIWKNSKTVGRISPPTLDADAVDRLPSPVLMGAGSG
jgi:hypothetical protein